MNRDKIEIGFYVFFVLFIIVTCIMLVFIGMHHECSLEREAYKRTAIKLAQERCKECNQNPF